MKVYLPINKDAQTGKGLFINRLAVALKKKGVSVTANVGKKCDVALHLTKMRHKMNAINVVRFDGVYHNTDQDYKMLNAVIKKESSRADAVIYQSKFSQIMSEKYVHKFDKPKTVIYNGADIEYFTTVKPIDSDYKINFLAFSRWRPHKRLKDIIMSFVAAEIPDSCLWIAGDLKRSGLSKKKIRRYFKRDDIHYLGSLTFPYLARYIVLADAVLHLCWFDCCPNSVVESICADTVVISNNVGGTPEIVEPSGIICDIDKPYDFEPVDLYHPPNIDLNIVASIMRMTVEDVWPMDNNHVDIDNIAEQYISFFHKLLGR